VRELPVVDEEKMLDLGSLALVVVCFALAAAYARLCNRLLAPAAGEGIAL
jgi:hypothetical protein